MSQLFNVAKFSKWSIPVVLVLTALLAYVSLRGGPLYTNSSDESSDMVIDSSASEAILADSRLPVKHGTFVYLVMGPLVPDQAWVASSKHPSVSVIFLAWHHTAKNARFNLPRQSPGQAPFNISIHQYANCSWAEGRNALFQLAMDKEEAQKWRFEYVIFWDDDVRLFFRNDITNESVVRDHQYAEQSLLRRLIKDRPARASVENSVYFLFYKLTCVGNCAFDAAVDVFHRTVVEHFLPYPTEFDKKNWWMSSETMSFRSAILSPQYCNLYRDIVVDAKGNAHRNYPKAALQTFQNDAIDTFMGCLNKVHFSELEGDALGVLQNLRRYGLRRPYPTEKTFPCTKQQIGVDYSDLLRSTLKNWPTECIL